MGRLIPLLALVLLAGLVAPAQAAPHTQTAPGVLAAQAALTRRGMPYVWGAKGPSTFDCSGLTYWSWLQAGSSIGVSTYDQANAGQATSCRLSDLAGAATTCWQAGDLILLRYSGGQHVAIYVGNGLFADAYNSATGVLVHNVASDSFYQANYWQSRRIAGDGAGQVDPGSSDTPNGIPGLEDLPDILGPVGFVVPQCGSCDPSGQSILPPTQWQGRWPSGFELLNLPAAFRTIIDWLAWQIGEIIRQLMCWLLSMLALLASMLSTIANSLIYGVNALFKMLVLIWLSLKAWFESAWLLAELIRELLGGIQAGLAGLAEFGRLVLDVSMLILGLIGRIVVLLGTLSMTLIGMIGWIGGLVLGFWLQLQVALSASSVPVQLAETHVIYRGTRGVLEGLRDSALGWIFIALWAMAYVAFVTWISRFLSTGEAS